MTDLPLAIWTWLAGIDARVWQALIAGLFLAVGWLVNGRQNRQAAVDLRAEKLRDDHRALYAEIGTALSNLWDEERIRGHARTITDRMERDPDFVPFIPRERNDHVFDTLLPDIHILPRQTIDPIVQYYSQIKALDMLAADMRGARYGRLSQRRRLEIYSDYIEMTSQALAFGQFALLMISAYAAGGAVAADEAAAGVSNRAVGRSDR